MQRITAISISAKSRSPTAVHFERLLHAVGREKGPIAICALELQQRLQLQSQATAQCSACFIGHFLKDSACWWNARKFVHFVDLEAIFPFSGYKCKYLVGIEDSSLLGISNNWWFRLNLLATVHSALPLLRKTLSTLLCHSGCHNLLCSAIEEWLQLSVKED